MGLEANFVFQYRFSGSRAEVKGAQNVDRHSKGGRVDV